ncbi:MAG: DUF1588 domain-containing protein [Acidobacteria bacterium]|nr:DUF1588 domain-containing protein [Acidobacteriota bacterium]
MQFPLKTVGCLAAVLLAFSGIAQTRETAEFTAAQTSLNKYCIACHSAKNAVGGFRLDSVASPESLRTEARRWVRLAARVREFEMPPKNAPAPTLDEREKLLNWVEGAVRRKACADGPVPGPAMIRRLNRDEYASTIRDLFELHIDIGNLLPAEGAGGEGFDNAAETLFLSPLHSEKYLELAKMVTEFAAKDFKPRARVLIAQPGPDLTPDAAARQILAAFLPRAFRRPITGADLDPYLSLFAAARQRGQTFEGAIFFALRGVLVSPMFLYLSEPPNPGPAARPADQFALASRLSYFLWGSMPDELLFDLAADGKLQEPAVLRELTGRMLRNDRSLVFAQRFVEQWLHTRELAGNKAPDAKLYPTWAADEDLRSDIRFQPILFFREILIRDRPILDLLDSKHTIGTNNLEKHLGLKLPLNANQRQQPQWTELPEGSRRGGLLGMPALLTVSSHPHRTSPVLRGAFILENILGTPPPPPPPNVPPLEETKEGATPKSVRARLELHRTNPQCASCHSRIDPIGFALENYDVMGRWRDTDGGQPVDAKAEMADGTRIDGPQELKAALLARRDAFTRNLTSKLLGFALGRGLTLADSCTVDAIVTRVREHNYSSQTLLEEIVLSVPFRQQAPPSTQKEK